ncbi:MAG: hypothetical protein GQ477_00010 [Nanohaloarchaea archaeon]|nr:hypothetical protein [Candidatus Nanohaloarchaea archaeon]
MTDESMDDKSYDTGFGLRYPKVLGDDVLIVQKGEIIPADQIPQKYYVSSLVASAIGNTVKENYGGVDPNTEFMENRPIPQANKDGYIPVDEHTSIWVE